MKHIFVVLFIALLCSSCKKDGASPTQSLGSQEKVTDYYPLTIGNYWIYQQYTADTSLVFTPMNRYDSVYVEKDSLYNGNIYKVVRSSFWSNVNLIRDSSDYLVSNNGVKLFTIKQDAGILGAKYPYGPDDSLFLDTWEMHNTDSVCNVPAGQFQAKYVIIYLSSTNPQLPVYPRFASSCCYAYVKNIGQVYERLGYFPGPNSFFDERLVRYHIN
jgi:hypothetical protein